MKLNLMNFRPGFPGILAAAGAALVLSSSLSPSFVQAAGFEKSVLWSGRWAPLGGAAASAVSGAEALYFNPAGLAAGDSVGEVTGNFSPIFGKFSGPIAGQQVDSNRSFSPSFGAFTSYKPTPKLGVGIGAYAAGGSKAIFENVDFTSGGTVFGGTANPALASGNNSVKSDLSIVELSAGAGYEVMDGLRIGAAYRVALVNANLASYAYDPRPASAAAPLTTVQLSNLTATRWNGFRLGAQYNPKESRWGLGAQWRSEIGFTATGDSSGTVTTATGTTLPLTGSTATVSDIFPQQFDLGGHYDILPNRLRAHMQYTFTEYFKDQSIATTGSVTAPAALGGASTAIPSIEQNWNNLHNLRFGLECFEVANWVFRAGYVFTSEVTPKDRARATFSSPGNGHTFVIGTGTNWMNNALETNLGLEYSFASGTVPAGSPNLGGTAGVPGDYSSNNYAAHLGVTYRI